IARARIRAVRGERRLVHRVAHAAAELFGFLERVVRLRARELDRATGLGQRHLAPAEVHAAPVAARERERVAPDRPAARDRGLLEDPARADALEAVRALASVAHRDGHDALVLAGLQERGQLDLGTFRAHAHDVALGDA